MVGIDGHGARSDDADHGEGKLIVAPTLNAARIGFTDAAGGKP